MRLFYIPFHNIGRQLFLSRTQTSDVGLALDRIKNRIKNFNLEYRENHVSLRHPVHRYCIQHHTTDRIPNKMLRAEAVAELRQCDCGDT